MAAWSPGTWCAEIFTVGTTETIALPSLVLPLCKACSRGVYTFLGSVQGSWNTALTKTGMFLALWSSRSGEKDGKETKQSHDSYMSSKSLQ